jgi:[ribosomal protein S18]-alanine N-acetyltransferase
MATFRLRRARLSDLPALLALERRSFTTDHLSERQYRHHIDNPNAAIVVAVDGDALLGKALVFFRRNSTVARLYSIAVADAARGRGLGEILLNAVEQAARARGCTQMRLEVRQDNASAVRLYERLGFEKFGARETYYEDGADAWRYRKALSARR